MRLKGKICLVTGAGAGIGEAIAVRFAEEGAKLVLNDLHEAAGNAVLDRVQRAGGAGVLVTGDVSREETARRMAAAAMREYGGIDVVVNNAADFTQKSVEHAEPADWERVFGVNVFGAAYVIKHAVAHMKSHGGSIVNIASMSGLIAQPDFATYNSSKGAVLTMTKCLAMDLAKYNIRANAICPGCILTSASYREIERLGLTFEQWRDRVAPQHLLNRLGEPVEVANPAVFLASDESSFITGTHLLVDGGYTAH